MKVNKIFRTLFRTFTEILTAPCNLFYEFQDTKKRQNPCLLSVLALYPKPESNRHGHCCPQDFKSCVSTYSTIRAIYLVHSKINKNALQKKSRRIGKT